MKVESIFNENGKSLQETVENYLKYYITDLYNEYRDKI